MTKNVSRQVSLFCGLWIYYSPLTRKVLIMILSAKPNTILIMFSQLMRKYGKNYLFTSQDKMLYLLGKYHGYTIKRRMLNYRLAELEKAGFIKRVQRNKKQEDGVIKPMTSLVSLTRRAYKLISRQLKALFKASHRDFNSTLSKSSVTDESSRSDLSASSVSHQHLQQPKQLLPII